jgi:hypothetical protein
MFKKLLDDMDDRTRYVKVQEICNEELEGRHIHGKSMGISLLAALGACGLRIV